MTSPIGDPTLASKETIYAAAEDGGSYTPDSGIDVLSQMDPVSRAKAESEWKYELTKTEEEIATLRQVLQAKIKYLQQLKKNLGITPWKEFRDDMEQSLRVLQESTAFQRTSQTLKSAGEKTTEALGSIGASVSQKLQDVKNSSTFKNIEDKVGNAYTNVKTKVSGTSPTEGQGSLEDSLLGDGVTIKTEKK